MRRGSEESKTTNDESININGNEGEHSTYVNPLLEDNPDVVDVMGEGEYKKLLENKIKIKIGRASCRGRVCYVV